MPQIGHDLEQSMPPLGNNFITINVSIKTQSSTHFFGTRTRLFSRSNQSRVSILTDIFEVYMLQVKFNRCNQNSSVHIYITRFM